MPPEDFRIEQVDERRDAVLVNLFEHYLHDMAEWFEFDSNIDGSYSFPTEQYVWDPGLDVYLAYSAELPIGFGLVGSAEEWLGDPHCRDMDEFFVVRRYRRRGVGQFLARRLWDEHPGPWLVRVFQRNRPALPFWRATIGAYTGGAFAEDVRVIDDRPWSFFTFQSPGKIRSS